MSRKRVMEEEPNKLDVANLHPLSPEFINIGGEGNYHINSQAPVMPQFYVNHTPDRSSQSTLPFSQSKQGRSPAQFGPRHWGAQFSCPAAWNTSGGSSGHMYTPSPSRGGFRSPSYGQQGSPRTSFGRGRRPINSLGIGSPHSNYCRGAWTSSGSRGPGRSAGRGRGFDGDLLGSREFGSMLEDPWKDLRPIVGNILLPRSGSYFWLPESLKSTKNASVAESSKKKTQSSLAEYLAQSFEEATNDETII